MSTFLALIEFIVIWGGMLLVLKWILQWFAAEIGKGIGKYQDKHKGD